MKSIGQFCQMIETFTSTFFTSFNSDDLQLNKYIIKILFPLKVKKRIFLECLDIFVVFGIWVVFRFRKMGD